MYGGYEVKTGEDVAITVLPWYSYIADERGVVEHRFIHEYIYKAIIPNCTNGARLDELLECESYDSIKSLVECLSDLKFIVIEFKEGTHDLMYEIIDFIGSSSWICFTDMLNEDGKFYGDGYCALSCAVKEIEYGSRFLWVLIPLSPRGDVTVEQDGDDYKYHIKGPDKVENNEKSTIETTSPIRSLAYASHNGKIEFQGPVQVNEQVGDNNVMYATQNISTTPDEIVSIINELRNHLSDIQDAGLRERASDALDILVDSDESSKSKRIQLKTIQEALRTVAYSSKFAFYAPQLISLVSECCM